jgi:hypothetical protein
LRNCATTPASAGAGSSRRVRPGRGHDPGEGPTRVAVGSVFAKSRNDPGLRRDRLLPPGQALPPDSLRPGAPPRSPHRGRTGAGRGGRGFAKSRNDPRVNRRGQFSCIGVRRHATQRDGPWGNRCRTHHRLPCSGLRGRAVEPGAWAIRIDPRLVYVPRGLSLKLHPMAIGLTYPPGNPTPRGRMIAIAGPHHNGVPNA